MVKGGYKDDTIDWYGLSVKNVLGWFTDRDCLSRCNESHTYGKWCQMGSKQVRRRSEKSTPKDDPHYDAPEKDDK